MLGGYENGGHPWKPDETITLKLDAPATPGNHLTPAIEAREQLGWRFGLTSYTFRDHTLFKTIDTAASMGLLYLGGLNVQTVSAGIPKKFDYYLTDEELRAVRNKFLDEGITLVTYYIHDIPADREVCEKIFEFGRKMGIKTFISEPATEALDIIEQYCIKYNIKLAIHNHGKDISPVYWDPKKLLEVVEGRSPLIGACGDLGYWSRMNIDPAEAVKILGDRVITPQVHDLHRSGPEGMDVAWGTGIMNMDQFMGQLKELGLQPSLIGLEYSRDWDRERPGIRQSIEYFDRLSVRLVSDKPYITVHDKRQ
ncbi:MAG: TIM barrel protein [Bacteroidales bacterium]